MTYSLTWLPAVLRAYGLTVVEQPDWKTRGHGDVGTIKGVVAHHTAGPLKGNAPSLSVVTNGRPDLPGPLAQLVLGRDGTFYVVAAGLCYHAGPPTKSTPASLKEWCGNRSTIGIEAENSGLKNDNPWPAVQIAAYQKGCAAILLHIHQPAAHCIGHFEWAPERKGDPSLVIGNRDALTKAMNAFRATVGNIMAEHAVTA